MLCLRVKYINAQYWINIMEFKDALNKLIDSKEFNKWHDENKDFFLTNVFVNEGDLQIGYCRHKDNKIVSFTVGNDNISKFEDDVFKRPETKSLEINIENVNVDIKDVLNIVEEARVKSYPSEDITKKIVILHNSKEGEIWNITLITKSFNMINFKIDAKEGNVLSNTKRSLLQLGSESK